MQMALSRATLLQGEREGPAKREGEVGGAANRHVGPPHPVLSPRPAVGEGKISFVSGQISPANLRKKTSPYSPPPLAGEGMGGGSVCGKPQRSPKAQLAIADRGEIRVDRAVGHLG